MVGCVESLIITSWCLGHEGPLGCHLPFMHYSVVHFGSLCKNLKTGNGVEPKVRADIFSHCPLDRWVPVELVCHHWTGKHCF